MDILIPLLVVVIIALAFLVVRLTLDKQDLVKKRQEIADDNKDLRDRKSQALLEVQAIRERLNSLVILPAHVYKVTYWVDGELIIRAGVISGGDKTIAMGDLYEEFGSKDRHINITLYPVAEQGEEAQP